jgi:hypothetical protein
MVPILFINEKLTQNGHDGGSWEKCKEAIDKYMTLKSARHCKKNFQ